MCWILPVAWRKVNLGLSNQKKGNPKTPVLIFIFLMVLTFIVHHWQSSRWVLCSEIFCISVLNSNMICLSFTHFFACVILAFILWPFWSTRCFHMQDQTLYVQLHFKVIIIIPFMLIHFYYTFCSCNRNSPMKSGLVCRNLLWKLWTAEGVRVLTSLLGPCLNEGGSFSSASLCQ